jgi:hypothetical protein
VIPWGARSCWCCCRHRCSPAAESTSWAFGTGTVRGYDYVLFRINANVAGQPSYQTFNGNGGNGQLVYNVNNWLGVLGNLAGYWATNSRAQGAAIPYLFGPRINFRSRKITPFAQVLLGGVVTSSGIQTSGWQSNFAMTAGGGFDIRVSAHFAIRPMQAEYFLTKIPTD